jgi:hypothetical protein
MAHDVELGLNEVSTIQRKGKRKTAGAGTRKRRGSHLRSPRAAV